MASVYTINYTDPNQGYFLIGLTDLNQDTSLRLPGRGRVNWGEHLNENFLHLLENFSSPEDAGNPGNPDTLYVKQPWTRGQLWHSSTDNNLYVYRYEGSPLVGTWVALLSSSSNISLDITIINSSGLLNIVDAPADSPDSAYSTRNYALSINTSALSDAGGMRILTGDTNDDEYALGIFSRGASGSPQDTLLFRVRATSGNVYATGDTLLGGELQVVDDTTLNSDLQVDGYVGINNAPPTGSTRLEVTGNIQANSQFLGSNQSAVTPTYSFTGDDNTGIYRSASNTLAIAAGGSARFIVNDSHTISRNPTLVIDGFSGSPNIEGGQIVLGYKDRTGLVGAQDSTWNIDVVSDTTYEDYFRIYNIDSGGIATVNFRMLSDPSVQGHVDIISKALNPLNLYGTGTGSARGCYIEFYSEPGISGPLPGPGRTGFIGFSDPTNPGGNDNLVLNIDRDEGDPSWHFRLTNSSDIAVISAKTDYIFSVAGQTQAAGPPFTPVPISPNLPAFAIRARGFDLCLGGHDTVARGNTGISRALVKDGGGVLTVNYPGGGAADFSFVKLGRGINGIVDCDLNVLRNVSPGGLGTDGVNVNQLNAAIASAGTFGTNWTGVARGFSTNYFPSASKYVAVSVRISYSGAVGGAGAILSINGNHIQSLQFPSNDFSGNFFLFGIVPPGQFYAIIPTAGGVSIISVHELL